MKLDFIESIPPQFRDIYTKGRYNPKVANQHFKVQQEALDMMQAIRGSSSLYSIMGESLFKIVTADKALNIDCRIFDMEAIKEGMRRSIEHTRWRAEILKSVGDGHVVIKRATGAKEALDQKSTQHEIVQYDFPATQLGEELKGAADDLERDFNAEFGEMTGRIHLGGGNRKSIDELGNASRGLMQQRLRQSDEFYFVHAVRAKPLHAALSKINWLQELN